MSPILLFNIICCIVSISSAATNSSGEVFHEPKAYKRSAYAYSVKWPGGIIPYAFDSSNGFSSDEINRIQNAMSTVTRQTGGCISFVQRTSESAYIIFSNSGGCSSPYGKQSSQPQTLYLSRSGNCIWEPTIIHEILHALGMMHEHKRIDRGSYVNINMANVNSNNYNDFLTDSSDSSTIAIRYDLYSVMHYTAYHYSTNGQPTISPIDSSVDINSIGIQSYSQMTVLDILKVKAFYGCSSSIQIRLKNLQTGLRLDSLSNGNPYTFTPNNGQYQVWTIQPAGDDTFNFINAATGKYLDSDANGNVYTLTGNGGNYQKWRFVAQRRVINVATGRALDSNTSGNLYTQPQNGGNYQNWVQE